MKRIDVTEFEKKPTDVMFDVLAVGETLWVDCGEAGAFVVLDEGEYNIMREALQLVISLAAEGKLTEEMAVRFAERMM